VDVFLYSLIAIVLIPFFLNPILLKLMWREWSEVNFEPIDPETLPQDVINHFHIVDEDFAYLGFTPCGKALLSNPKGNGKVYVSLWFHREALISGSATVGYMCPKNQAPRLFSKSVSFVTRFSEQSQWETSNSGVPTPLAPLPFRPCINLPTLETAKSLFTTHLLLARKFHPGSERLVPKVGEEFLLMARKMAEIKAYQAKAGRWVLDRDPRFYRFTWKGALVAGWQHTWPVNRIRKWLLKKRSKGLVLGLSQN
jgi:hypothetical protein